MLGRTSVVGMIAVVVALGLVSPVKASGIKGGYRLVDLRASDDPYQQFWSTPHIDDAGNIGRYNRPTTGDYSLDVLYDPYRPGSGISIGNVLRRAGSDDNLLPQALRSPDIWYKGVNSQGQAVGDYNKSGRAPFVVDTATGDVTVLKYLPGADGQPHMTGINNLGQLIGFQDNKAIFYESPTATPIELAELLGTDTGWDFREATGLNNRGEIVGYGYGPDGRNGTFKLEPVTVPEPSSLLVFSALGLGLGAWRATRRGRAGGRS